MLGSRLRRILNRNTLAAHRLAKVISHHTELQDGTTVTLPRCTLLPYQEVTAVSTLRGIFTSPPRFGLKEDFEASVSSLDDLPEVDNQVELPFSITITPNSSSSGTDLTVPQTKLKFYALYKQATHGVCDAKKPGAFDFVVRGLCS